jgi:hypothetical protein
VSRYKRHSEGGNDDQCGKNSKETGKERSEYPAPAKSGEYATNGEPELNRRKVLLE